MDLQKLYELRRNFILIGLTGRVGAGCTTIAEIFSNDTFDDCEFPKPKEDFTTVGNENSDRKYKIAHNFLQENWEPFFLLKYSKVISLIVFKQKLDNLEMLLEEVKGIFKIENLDNELGQLRTLKSETDFESQSGNHDENYALFNSHEFAEFHKKFDAALRSTNAITRIKILHTICNNQRRGGCYFCEKDPTMNDIYSIADEINSIIKGHRNSNNKVCKVVIDSLRNPLEIMYFKERFSAYYTLAINPEEEIKEIQLKKKYGSLVEEIKSIDILEYGEKNNKDDFYKQNIQKCIEKADLHLSFIDNSDKDLKREITYPFSIKQQSKPPVKYHELS